MSDLGRRLLAVEVSDLRERIDKLEGRLLAVEASHFRERIAELKGGRRSRWVQLKRTSPSGKTLFVCTCCGNVSPVPTMACRTFDNPEETWGCSTFELEAT